MKVKVFMEFEIRSSRAEFMRRILLIDLIVVLTGLGIYLAIVLRGLLLDFLISGILAIVLEPIVRGLSKLRMRRSIAVVFVVFIGLTAISGLLYIFTKPLYQAGVTFVHELPTLVSQAQNGQGQFGLLIKQLHIESWVAQNTSRITSALTNFTGPVISATRTVLSGITGFITIALLAVFIMLEGPVIIRGVLGLLSKNTSTTVIRTIEASERAVAGYVFGNVATSTIAGIIVGVTLWLLGVPFVLLLALWVAVVDLLPLVGGLLAGVPTVAIAFLHSPIAGLVSLVVFIAYQQVENHILNPIIMAKAVKLNPLWVLISVLVGADLAGFLGALIGIPVAAMIQVVSAEVWKIIAPRYQARQSDTSQTDLGADFVD
ncbi:AI-2E family transporter [Acidithrix ferrooxidans]|nr:AI-2E family transporter [Acidithrix ferrooxidans]